MTIKNLFIILVSACLTACTNNTNMADNLLVNDAKQIGKSSFVKNTPFETYAAQPAPKSRWILLGTNGGPEGEIDRSQPANALFINDDLYLIDVGDGAGNQLKKAGHRLLGIQGIFLSHLHFDHTGGLLAIFGTRMQINGRNKVTVYGPKGTKKLVTGILASMESIAVAAYGMPGVSWQANVEVVELTHDSVVELNGGATVKVATNTHFAIPQASGLPEKAEALSFRFDMQDRSIVYTGDTGPSKRVEVLAKGADLLVSEMMDIPAVLARVDAQNPNMPAKQRQGIEWHFRAHHITPEQVGELAAAAEVPAVVITHIAPSIRTREHAQSVYDGIRSTFDGEIGIGNDLEIY